MAIRLTAALQEYAWGSPTALHDFLGQAPTGRPAAELWYGAHPAAPATAHADGAALPLDALLAREPGLVGGAELPLVKVLSAQRALSLQVHPDAAQAARGFASGEVDAAGALRFVDPRPKPELIVALTPFRALSGTRPAGEVRTVTRALAVPALDAVLSAYATDDPTAAALALRALLALPVQEQRQLVAAVRAAAAALEGSPEPLVARYADLVAVLHDDHPDDVGLVAALLLNDLDLAPGEALYQPARVLHAYVRGTGVEVMASSDNVLRCGLTGKRIDVDGLFACLDPTPVAPQRPVIGETPWTDPSGSFRVARLVSTAEPRTVPVAGPCVVLCTEGPVEVVDGGRLVLQRGSAALVPAGSSWQVVGEGVVFACGAG